jgi:hypothetical protein
MIKGPRRSAKQAVEKFIETAILKLEVCTENVEPIRNQLQAIHSIACTMSWHDIARKIEKALQPKRKE